MLEKTELLKLMKATAKADPSNPVAYSYNGENLSYEALNETLRNELNAYAGTYALYRENKNTIFELISQSLFVRAAIIPARSSLLLALALLAYTKYLSLVKSVHSNSRPARSAAPLRLVLKSSLMAVLILLS